MKKEQIKGWQQKRKAPKGYSTPLEPSRQILLEDPFHDDLQRVGRVADRLEHHIKSTSLVNREKHLAHLHFCIGLEYCYGTAGNIGRYFNY
jgi:hypothetical protein